MFDLPTRFLTLTTLLCLVVFLSEKASSKNMGMEPKTLNFSSFPSISSLTLDNEQKKFTPVNFTKHPEFGLLPHNTQCSDCFELIQERTTYSRVFLKKNSNGNVKYYQKAYDPLHYKDENGNYRTIDKRLRPHPTSNKVYYAPYQEVITEVDLNRENVKLSLRNDALVYNQDLHLISINDNGEEKVLAKANWDNASVGEDGVIVKDIFPGIDMEVLALRGSFKTNFIIQNKNFLPQNAEKLIIRDNLELPKGYTLD